MERMRFRVRKGILPSRIFKENDKLCLKKQNMMRINGGSGLVCHHSFYALLNLKDESRSASASLIPVESIRQAIRNGAYAFSGSERNFTKPNFQRK
jgi:hypothetical protein